MADDTGYSIVRNAVSPALAREVAAAIDGGLPTTNQKNKFSEFQVPQIGRSLFSELLQVSCYPYLYTYPSLTPEERQG